MTDRWKQIDEILQAALERDPSDRAAFLDNACAGDQAVRAKVEALLASDKQARSFLESPALEVAPEMNTEHYAQEVEGRAIGPYKVISRLGAGGMGEVYLARDTRLGRNIALKVLPSELTKDEQKVLRFKQEARTASALNHPNILTIYDIGESDSLHFIATEFVNGETLRDRIVRSQMAWQEALDIIIQAAGALAAAHKAGIVHRDVKPENIMIRSDGFVKVLDFGIAKLTERKATGNDYATAIAPLVDTQPGLVIGTPKYMSPEQARGFDLDGRSDIFSLGAVLYELVAGRHPFEGQTLADSFAAILEKEPAPVARHVPDAPMQLQMILTRSLQKDRGSRYQVIEEMIEDLKWLKQQAEGREHQKESLPMRGSRADYQVTTNRQPVIETPQYLAGLSDEMPTLPPLAGGNLPRRVANYKKGAALALAILLFIAMLSFLLYKFLNKNQTATDSPQVNVITVTPHDIDKPTPIDLGVINELRLDRDEKAYFKTSLPAGEYKVVLDIRRAIGRNTNLQGALSILDQDGAVSEPKVILLNEVDVNYRKLYRLSLKKPVTLGLELSSSNEKTDFWLTVLKGSAPAPLPFLGKISPAPIHEQQVVSGELDEFEYAYYIIPLKRGDYKAILDFTNSEGRKTNIQGYLALLDEEGGDQKNIARVNEIDVSCRTVAPFHIKNDSRVILRIKNDTSNKYSMKILPASQ